MKCWRPCKWSFDRNYTSFSRKYEICIFSWNHFEKSTEVDHHRLSWKKKWWLNDRIGERGHDVLIGLVWSARLCQNSWWGGVWFNRERMAPSQYTTQLTFDGPLRVQELSNRQHPVLFRNKDARLVMFLSTSLHYNPKVFVNRVYMILEKFGIIM